MADKKLEKLKLALKDKDCTLKKHSNVIEIIFKKEKDADWFQNNFNRFQKESAACCLMPIRPRNAPPKFIFNVTNMDKLIDLLNKR